MDKKIVYTYLCYDGREYKIGQSINPQNRLLSLRTANPRIRMICYGLGAKEKDVHKLFADNRFAGEWFRLNEDEFVLVKELITGKKFISSGEAVFTFGKYKGTRVRDMYNESHINYMVWIVRNFSDPSDLIVNACVHRLRTLKKKGKTVNIEYEKLLFSKGEWQNMNQKQAEKKQKETRAEKRARKKRMELLAQIEREKERPARVKRNGEELAR